MPACLYIANLPPCHHHLPLHLCHYHPTSLSYIIVFTSLFLHHCHLPTSSLLSSILTLQSFCFSLSCDQIFLDSKFFLKFPTSKCAIEVCDISCVAASFLVMYSLSLLFYFCSCMQFLAPFDYLPHKFDPATQGFRAKYFHTTLVPSWWGGILFPLKGTLMEFGLTKTSQFS